MNDSCCPLIIGNWKMNPQSASLAKKLFSDIKNELRGKVAKDTSVVIAPPSLYLEKAHKINGRSKYLTLGAQTVHHAKLGAYTGEVSISMLKDLEVTTVILGHSDRRATGETDELVNQKLRATIKAGMVGVVCIGENKRDTSGHYLSFIEQQIRKAMASISRAKLGQIVIAYEPIWAIGTGDSATSTDIHEMKLFIEKIISDIYGRNMAKKVRIIYGGSVNKRNAKDLHKDGMMNGFLVGGASLHAEEFAEIIKEVQKV